MRRRRAEAVAAVQTQAVVEQLFVEKLAERGPNRAAGRCACQCRKQGSGDSSQHRAAGTGHDGQACADLQADSRTYTGGDPGG